jgi:hypothetical protein
MGKIMPKKAKSIKVTCDVADTLPLETIIEFQGEFKKRDQYDIENIVKSLILYGISFPFFIWQNEGVNYCLDGHGRRLALYVLLNRGYEIPPAPVVYILAKDRAEAVQKLLRLNSRYGTMTEESVVKFIDKMPVELSEIAIPDTETIEFAGMPKNLDSVFSTDVTPKEKNQKTCPYCGGTLK